MNMASVSLTVATAIYKRNHLIVDIAFCTVNADDKVQNATLPLVCIQEIQRDAMLQMNIIETQECHLLHAPIF
jgi:hypothetical protein